MVSDLLIRLRALFRRDAVESELDDELRFHLDRQIDKFVQSGLPLPEARRQARLMFGGADQIKEECRQARGVHLVETLAQDLRYGLRRLRKSPGFTGVAVLTLALGIGANTAIFSLVHSLFLRLLPVPNASQLVHVYGTRNGHGHFPLSYLDYLEYRDRVQSISDLAAQYPTSPINLVVSGESQLINGGVVTHNYFRVLQLAPSLGRFFGPQEDQVPGGNAVAVISYRLWQRRFGNDPQILGKAITLNGARFTIVGVAPEDFQGAVTGISTTDVWIPSSMFHLGYRYCDAFQRDCRVVTLIGRLRPESKLPEAQAEMRLLAQQLESAHPETNRAKGVAVIPARGVRPDEQGENAKSATLLSAVVALVLLIACANLAGLLLARSSARQKEILVRLALGASRARLVRQLLTESLLLAMLGGACSLLVAFGTQRILLKFYAASSAGGRYFVLSLDPTVLLFALGISILTGICFGLVPALRASRPAVADGLKDQGASSSPRDSRLRDILVVAQVALSIALVIGSGLVVRSLQNIYRGAGYDPSHLMWLRLRPSLIGYSAEKAWAYQREVVRRVEALPGVVSASPQDYSPLNATPDNASVRLPGLEPAGPDSGYRVAANQVGPRYFATFGIPVWQGREFSEQDRKGTPDVAIVNETLAHHFWPAESPVGKVIGVDDHTYEIVGVVRDAQFYSVTQQPVPFLYTAYWQQDTTDSWGEDSRMLVRVAGDPRAMLPQIRREIMAVDANVPISEDRPFSDALAERFQPVRMASTFLICFGALALLLSAIGLHGILAFTVSQRTREIGIRMALGAERRDVAGMILRQAGWLALAGALIGLIAAVASARFLASYLYGVRPHDPWVFLAAPVVLLGVALLASYLPARRAMGVDPMAALRHE
jgi:predicted permease